MNQITEMQAEVNRLLAELEAERAKSERTRIAIESLTNRADWLRSEYRNGGDYDRLKAREEECRYLYDRLQKTEEPYRALQAAMDQLLKDDGDLYD